MNFGDAMTCVKMACLGVADIKIDSDNDLIPDIVEFSGILLTDLSFVYTNPHDEDKAIDIYLPTDEFYGENLKKIEEEVLEVLPDCRVNSIKWILRKIEKQPVD